VRRQGGCGGRVEPIAGGGREMMSELVQDIRTEFRESPGIVAMVVFAIAIGIGFNAAIFWEADGDGLRMSASRAESIENQLSRLRSHDCTGVRKPGVTLIMGLRQYSVELSVPVPRVGSL